METSTTSDDHRIIASLFENLADHTEQRLEHTRLTEIVDQGVNIGTLDTRNYKGLQDLIGNIDAFDALVSVRFECNVSLENGLFPLGIIKPHGDILLSVKTTPNSELSLRYYSETLFTTTTDGDGRLTFTQPIILAALFYTELRFYSGDKPIEKMVCEYVHVFDPTIYRELTSINTKNVPWIWHPSMHEPICYYGGVALGWSMRGCFF